MRILLAGLLIAASAMAGSFTVTQVSYQDCKATGCNGRVQDGDTTIFTSWRNTGNITLNGVSLPGYLYGTINDGNIFYDPDSGTDGSGPYCAGSNPGGNIIWLRIPDIELTGSVGTVYSQNCMHGFGSTPGDTVWAPAASGTCTSGVVGPCDWKSMGNFCIDGTCYLQVFRQERNDGANQFRGHDSTLIKTSDGGLTWLNPAHVGGGTPDAFGDAPAGPGDASYPASMIWPDPVSHNGLDQKMARVMFFQYGQDGASWPSVDNNATYVYTLSFDGNFQNYYVARVLRANMANLSASDWSYYKCATYPGTVCDGMNSLNWSSLMSDATPVMTGVGIGGVFYTSELQTYVYTGGDVAPDFPIRTAPHPWGPWTLSANLSASPRAGMDLRFASPLMPTVKTVTAGQKIQFTISAEFHNTDNTGLVSYVTYEMTSSGSTLAPIRGAGARK